MAEQIDVSARLDSAADRAEQAADILHAVANGGPADQVQTNNGPVPSVAKWMADHEASFTAQAEAVLGPVTEQAGIAVAAAEAAGVEAGRAETAAEAANATGKMYPDTTAGLAATVSGEYFSVPSASAAESFALYRNVAGVATDTGKRYPSSTAVSSLASSVAIKADAAPKKNLFNPNDPGVVVGYYVNGADGQLAASAGFRTTGFIPVTAGASYACSSRRQFAWYDSNYTFISGDVAGGAAPFVVTAPVGAKFFRTAVSDAYLSTFQIEAGSANTAYEPWTLVLSSGLAPLSVSADELQDGAVSPDKASFFEVAKNLFDPSAALIGYYLGNDGGLFANAAYEVSDYIPVTAGETYSLTAFAGSGVRFTCYFAEDKVFVAGGYSGPSTAHSFVAPAGVAFVRATIYQASHNAFQFEHGAATGYEPYRLIVKEENLPTASSPAPEVVIPPYVYGVQGREANVYFDNLFLSHADDFLVDAAASVGVHQQERWTWTPTAGVTSGALTVSAHDRFTGDQLASAIAQIRAAASSAGSGSTKTCLFIGDSLIAAGTITQTLLDIAEPDAMDVSLIGTGGTAPNRFEGRGGWSVADYTTAGRTYYEFAVSGVAVEPAINSSTYTNNGNTYTVQEVSLVGGAGIITCSVSPLNGAPTASGTLTKTFGSGDATISFSSATAVSGNPFWIGGQLNFAQYLANNGYSAPDWVMIHLGINDVFAYTSDAAVSAAADTAFSQLDGLIASIKAAGASTKVGLMLPTPPASSQDAFGSKYGSGQNRWRDKRNILIWVRQLIAKYVGQEASRIYIVPSNVALDTVHGYPTDAAAPVNSRTPGVTVSRQNNAVHPAENGYQQIGDAVWAFLKCTTS
ncbi:MAG: SGNH/GDSL hydrolase family protein [Pseudomonas sp.]|nr:SGNH/GDSL hydrolase family protein [Pseudomonas sp.]